MSEKRCDNCEHWERGGPPREDGVPQEWGMCYGVPPVLATTASDSETFPRTLDKERCPNHTPKHVAPEFEGLRTREPGRDYA